MPQPEVSFARYFADLPDPRVDRTRWHRLDDILVIALCAVVCGADSFEEIERFGEAREDWPSGRWRSRTAATRSLRCPSCCGCWTSRGRW